MFIIVVLPQPEGPDDRHELALVDVEADVVDDAHRPVGGREVDADIVEADAHDVVHRRDQRQGVVLHATPQAIRSCQATSRRVASTQQQVHDQRDQADADDADVDDVELEERRRRSGSARPGRAARRSARRPPASPRRRRARRASAVRMCGTVSGMITLAEDLGVAGAERARDAHVDRADLGDAFVHHDHAGEERGVEQDHRLGRLADAEIDDDQRDQGDRRQGAEEVDQRIDEACARSRYQPSTKPTGTATSTPRKTPTKHAPRRHPDVERQPVAGELDEPARARRAAPAPATG